MFDSVPLILKNLYKASGCMLSLVLYIWKILCIIWLVYRHSGDLSPSLFQVVSIFTVLACECVKF